MYQARLYSFLCDLPSPLGGDDRYDPDPQVRTGNSGSLEGCRNKWKGPPWLRHVTRLVLMDVLSSSGVAAESNVEFSSHLRNREECESGKQSPKFYQKTP